MGVKNWVTRALLNNGTLSPTFTNLTVNDQSTFPSGAYIAQYYGGTWINMSTSGPSGMGTGGPGMSPWIAYASNDGDWFPNTKSGDIVIRNGTGRILLGNVGDQDAILIIENQNLYQNAGYTTNSATLTGTTAGTVISSMPEQGVSKKVVAYANGYENHTTTAQTITFPTAFSNPPIITSNTTGLSLTVSTTELTITSPDNTTAYSGVIIVEGI